MMLVVLLAARTGEVALAARLHGALADHLELARHSIPPGQHNVYDRTVGLVRQRLGDEAFAREMGSGAGYTRRSMRDEAAPNGRPFLDLMARIVVQEPGAPDAAEPPRLIVPSGGG